MISELMQDDLPEPVAPATSRCGIFARLAHDEAALDVLAETDHASGGGRTVATAARSTSPRLTISLSVLGISMPIADLPGIGDRIRTSALATA